MQLWRVSEWRDLTGAGALKVSGRWHLKGRPVVYLASTRSQAMLEVLVHYEEGDAPPDFQLLALEVPDDIATDRWPLPDVGELRDTQIWGTQWLNDGRTALARVPSAIVPGELNWLLNPAHPDARRVEIMTVTRHPWDRRLF